MKRKKFIKDSIFNIISSIIPVIILQLIIFPIIAKYYSADKYGQFLTLLSVFNLIPAVLGLSLNNYMLIKDSTVKPTVFNVFYKYIILNSILTFLLTYYLFRSFLIDILFTLVISNLWLLRDFLIVYFQKKLNYFNLLINTIILTIGYYIGFVIFRITYLWQYIYFVGLILSILHVLFFNKEILEDFRNNIVTRSIINNKVYEKEMNQITISAVMIRLTTYADRLLLFPFVGGRFVAIYYASTFTSKIIAMGINPITAVILAYLSKTKKRPQKLINIYLSVVTLICIFSYFIIVKISNLILKRLYPEFFNEALKLIPYATIAILLYVLISIINPLLLKYKELKWQFILNSINLIIYILLAFIFITKFGITGFAISIIITNLIKLIFMIFILYYVNDYV